MNFVMWIDKQSNGPLLGRPGLGRQTRALPVASEARAPPTAVVTTTTNTAP